MDAFSDLLRRLSQDVTSLANELRRLLAIRSWLEELVVWWRAGFEPKAIGTAYTLEPADNWKLLQSSGSSATLVTFPTDAEADFPIGRSQVNFQRGGTGTLTLVGAAGVTLDNASSLSARAQNSVITGTKIGANHWLVTGDMT